MKRAIAIAATAALALTPGLALAWRALNGNEVVQVSGSVFEVIGRAGRSGPADYWCGAGDFALSVLGVSATTPVYIWNALGPSTAYANAKAVQFSLNVPPGGPAPQSYSLSVKAVGDSLTAAAARQYCLDDRLLRF